MNILKKIVWPKGGNWGLKLISLVLAIVIYYTIKTETAGSGSNHDRTIFQSR